MTFWVVGGNYENTKFNKIKKGYKLERFGPFKSYDEAMEHWSFQSWKKVDDCNIRYVISPKR